MMLFYERKKGETDKKESVCVCVCFFNFEAGISFGGTEGILTCKMYPTRMRKEKLCDFCYV